MLYNNNDIFKARDCMYVCIVLNTRPLYNTIIIYYIRHEGINITVGVGGCEGGGERRRDHLNNVFFNSIIHDTTHIRPAVLYGSETYGGLCRDKWKKKVWQCSKKKF